MIKSVDNQEDKIQFVWKLEQNPDHKSWTRLTMKFTEPLTIKSGKWWLIAPAGAIPILGLLTNGVGKLQQAYASTSAMPIIPQTTSTIPSAIASTSTASILSSKPVIASIFAAILVAGGGGAVVSDAYYSEPYVEYTLYPSQLPADLYGTSLVIKNIHSTDDKSKIIHYDCNDELIIFHGLEYTFDCMTENSLGNKEFISTSVFVREPPNLLDMKATNCISQHYMLYDNITEDYPYLLDLPYQSQNGLSDLKEKHKELMDNYYENHDFVYAKKHATIILKYFDANDIQALSTMGNTIRDEDRNNLAGTKCALLIHNTPLLSNTVWGKLSLAEDYHVLGNYQKTMDLSSLVIDDYENNNSDIPEISYVNALIIKANALYRLALEEKTGFDDAKMYYTMANEIRESYDTWFGLGNIDRQEEKFADALEKYNKAKNYATETDEIDLEIKRVLSMISNV